MITFMEQNKTISLFSDGSVNPQLKIGFSAYLLLDNNNLNENHQILQKNIQSKRFENTSSTKLELEGLLWALSSIKNHHATINVYTDCQNILTLLKRRERLEQNNYLTQKGTNVKNEELYKAFYKLIDQLSCHFIKVKGHQKTATKNEIDKIFTLVDRNARQELRQYISTLS